MHPPLPLRVFYPSGQYIFPCGVIQQDKCLEIVDFIWWQINLVCKSCYLTDEDLFKGFWWGSSWVWRKAASQTMLDSWRFSTCFWCLCCFTWVIWLAWLCSLYIRHFYASAPVIVVARGIMILGCLPIRPFVPFSWTRYLRNTLRDFLLIWYKLPFGLKDELIRIWWSKVTLTSQNTFLAITQEFIR